MPDLTPSDPLRAWALRLRSLLAMDPNARTITVTLADGATVDYQTGEGLTYTTPDGDGLTLPETVLDEERWELAA